MPTPTYTPLATVTLSSSASSVTFSSIPATYRDLVVVHNIVSANPSFGIQFNSDTGSNYSEVGMYGDGSSAASYSLTSQTRVYAGNNATRGITNIMDYSATDKHKSVLIRATLDEALVQAIAVRWANTAAITSMRLFKPFNTFNAGTTLTLYGIAA